MLSEMKELMMFLAGVRLELSHLVPRELASLLLGDLSMTSYLI